MNIDKKIAGLALILIVFIVLVVGSVSIMDQATKIKPSPADRISYDNISTTKNNVTVRVQDPIIVAIENTGSMIPTFNEDSNLIEIVPKSPDELNVGDIVSYQYGDDVIVHRIIEIGNDENGWYARFKGDNNPVQDPGRIRFSQIKRLVVGIIY
ncbi:MAG: hypothetical protein ABIA21_04050 [Candidatus Aenigmatarchaeota archaeon]